MPYPYEYAVATQTWLDVLDAVRDETDLTTRNQAFTVMEGVLRAFRRRLEVQDSLRFADELPVAVWAVVRPRLGPDIGTAALSTPARPGRRGALLAT